MGKVKTTWLLPGHSGRPCHHEDIYTKMNKKTGQVYSVKLCYPSEKVTANQVAQRNNFGLVSMALSAWIRQNKEATATDHAAYMAVKAQYDRQTKYSTLRGYMMAKNMAVAQTDGSVVITIGTYTTTVTGGVVDDGTGGSGNENQNPGENQGTGEGSGNTPQGGGGNDDDNDDDNPGGGSGSGGGSEEEDPNNFGED
ncbi:MAG TPA: hypothetical protein O0W79_04735 [Methanocorpusculum sp.]|nr:hypothetical protein [Methanocorpusculum sp.]